MIPKTRLAGGIAALVLSAASPAGASSPPSLPMLGGSVTLSGSASFVRDVVIARPVTFTVTTWHLTWKIQSTRGRFAGFALREANPRATGATFALNTGFCVARACDRAAWAPFAEGCLCGFESADPATVTLKAGKYRLYLIADDAPVTVTLSMPGLSGRTVFRSGGRPRVTIDTLPPSQLAPPMTAGMGGNLYSAGTTHPGSTVGGIHFVLGWKLMLGPPRSVNQAGACLWEGTPDSGTLAPYQYPCDAASATDLHVGGQVATGAKTGPLNALDQYATFFEYFGLHGAGPVSGGGYVNSESPATEAHTQLLWLDFTA